MVRRPPRSTRTTPSVPPRRSSVLARGEVVEYWPCDQRVEPAAHAQIGARAVVAVREPQRVVRPRRHHVARVQPEGEPRVPAVTLGLHPDRDEGGAVDPDSPDPESAVEGKSGSVRLISGGGGDV